jgi:hypothetical protein
MARKPVPHNKRAKAAGISLPPDLTKVARRFAYEQGMSLSAFVRTLIIARLAEENAQ